MHTQHYQEQPDSVSAHRERERVERSASEHGLDIVYTQELINLLEKRDSGQGVNTHADAAARVAELFSVDGLPKAIGGLAAFGREKLSIHLIEESIAQHTKTVKSISLSCLILLARLHGTKSLAAVSEDLIRAFEWPETDSAEKDRPSLLISPQLQKQLEILAAEGTANAHALLYDILDFMDVYGEQIMTKPYMMFLPNTDTDCFYVEFAKTVSELSFENYLVARRCDGLASRFGYNFASDDPESDFWWSNDADGPEASYASRYAMRHVLEDSKLRFMLGIGEGNSTHCYMLTTGFASVYRGDVPSCVFPFSESDEQRYTEYARQCEQEYSDEEKQLIARCEKNSDEADEYLDEWEHPLPFIDPARSFMSLVNISTRISIAKTNEQIFAAHGFAPPKKKRPLSPDAFASSIFRPWDSPERTREYWSLMRPSIREVVEQDFSLRLSDFNPWVQRSFLAFLNRYPMKRKSVLQREREAPSAEDPAYRRMEKVQVFLKQFGGDGLKTFLATEDDLLFSEEIFALGEKFGDAAKPLFGEYAAIVETAQRAGDYLREQFGHSATAEPIIESFIKNLLARGKELLRSLTDRQDSHRLLEELSGIDVSTTLICSGVTALRGEQVPLSEIKAFRMDVLSSHELRGRQDLLATIRTSYERSLRAERYTDVDIVGLINAFDARINDPENASRFYIILRQDGAKSPLIGFTVFTDTAQGEKFWSALTIEDAYKRSGFYSSILMQALEHESRGSLIRGEATVGKDIAASHIERSHFDGVRYEYLPKERVGILTIERSVQRTEKPSIPSDIAMFGSQEVLWEIEEKVPMIAFEVPREYLSDRERLEEIFVPLQHGYHLVRYTKDTHRAQLVFTLRYQEEGWR